MSGSSVTEDPTPTEDEEAVHFGSPKGRFGARQPAVYLLSNNSASRSDDDGSVARDVDDNSAVHGEDDAAARNEDCSVARGDDATAARDSEGFVGHGGVWATARDEAGAHG